MNKHSDDDVRQLEVAVGMTTSDILWTVGSAVLGSVVSFGLQAWKGGKPAPTVQIGGDNFGTVEANQNNQRTKIVRHYSTAYNQTVIINNPPQPPSRQPTSPKPDPDSDIHPAVFIVGGIVVAGILAWVYATYHTVIITVTTIFTGLAAGAIVGTLIYLLIRKRGVLDLRLWIQIIGLVIISVACFFSISFLSKPPIFFGNSSLNYVKLLQLFQTKGYGAVGEAGVNGIGFLVYQLIGAALTIGTTLLIIAAAAKMIAIVDLATGVAVSGWRVKFAVRKPKAGAIIWMSLFTIAIAGLLTSGLLARQVLDTNKIIPTGPSKTTSQTTPTPTATPTKPTKPTKASTSKTPKPSKSSTPTTSQ